jgi:hypothetical protein
MREEWINNWIGRDLIVYQKKKLTKKILAAQWILITLYSD